MKKLLDNNILLFLEELSSSCSIPKENLFKKWNDFNSKKLVSSNENDTVEKKVVKKSGYQNFFF